MQSKQERSVPIDEFPYKPVDPELKKKFLRFFQDGFALRFPVCKRVFDLVLSFFILVILFPILLVIFLFKVLDKDSPIFCGYGSVSQGKKFKKIKFCVISKTNFDKRFDEDDWRAYRASADLDRCTVIGRYLKMYYLDELPQLFSIFRGDMTFVGPRPLSIEHYEVDLSQGNMVRKICRGGLLGPGHVHKGTEAMGDPNFEFEYAAILESGKCLRILGADLKILLRGMSLVLRGEGL